MSGSLVTMRAVREYEIGEEEFESQRAAGRYNPALTLTYRDKAGRHTVTISAGRQDDIDVFREGETTYVLSQNRGLGYVGLETFVAGEASGDIFLQVDSEIEAVLGKRGLDLAPVTIAKRLREYIS